MRPSFRRSSTGALALVLTAAGCFTSDEGLQPPATGFYFPTGLAVSPGATTLYVANSDFDLHYNGGTVQALDLRMIRADVTKLRDAIVAGASRNPCEAASLPENTNPV